LAAVTAHLRQRRQDIANEALRHQRQEGAQTHVADRRDLDRNGFGPRSGTSEVNAAEGAEGAARSGSDHPEVPADCDQRAYIPKPKGYRRWGRRKADRA
jgi:hypothetical protein